VCVVSVQCLLGFESSSECLSRFFRRVCWDFSAFIEFSACINFSVCFLGFQCVVSFQH